MTRKTFGIAASLILTLVIGFGCGSLWTKFKTSNAQARKMFVQSWISPLELLTQNSYTAHVLTPKQVSQTVGMQADVASMELAYIYDELPQGYKDGIVRYTKAAKNVAIAQNAKGFLNDRRHLLIFADCLQKTQKTGGSVRVCAKREGMYEPSSSAESGSSSTRTSAMADAR